MLWRISLEEIGRMGVYPVQCSIIENEFCQVSRETKCLSLVADSYSNHHHFCRQKNSAVGSIFHLPRFSANPTHLLRSIFPLIDPSKRDRPVKYITNFTLLHLSIFTLYTIVEIRSMYNIT